MKIKICTHMMNEEPEIVIETGRGCGCDLIGVRFGFPAPIPCTPESGMKPLECIEFWCCHDDAEAAQCLAEYLRKAAELVIQASE